MRLGAGQGLAGGVNAGGVELPFDLIICDLMLPGATGKELIATVRERTPELPVVVISARTSTTDRIDLLKLGADDYLTKPFDLDELAARVEVQLRHRLARERGATARNDDLPGHGAREGDNTARTLLFRAWELDPASRTFSVDGAPVAPAPPSTARTVKADGSAAGKT